jgi:hypothetical protein
MNMNNEIKTAVEEAILPLKKDIESLKAQLAALAPLVKLAEHQAKIQAAQESMQKAMADFKLIVDAIPEDLKQSLKVKGIEVDPPNSR